MIRYISASALALAVLASNIAATPPPTAAPAASKPAAPQARTSGRPRPGPAASGSPNGSATAFDLGVWTVHASSLDANFKSGDFSTPSKVVMTRVGGDVTADRANGNYKKKLLYLNGHVVMHDSQGGASLGEGGPTQSQGPSTLTADKAQIDGQAKMYQATGNVHYVQGDTNVTADNGTLNEATHQLLLEGTVHIVEGSRSMRAQRVVYNTQSGTAHAQGDVTMQFPGELHRHLATPKPLKAPKNPVTQPVEPPDSSP